MTFHPVFLIKNWISLLEVYSKHVHLQRKKQLHAVTYPQALAAICIQRYAKDLIPDFFKVFIFQPNAVKQILKNI